MAVSALRVAACAGVLVGGLMLGCSGTGLASADPSDMGQGSHDRESSKGVESERPSLSRLIHRILSEHRKLTRNEPRRAPRAKIGSDPDSGFVASESNVTTFAESPDESDEPDGAAPELVPDNVRGAEPASDHAGTAPAPQAAASGSDHIDNIGNTDNTVGNTDNTVDNTVDTTAPKPEKKASGPVVYPFPYYWLDFGGVGGDWWNANRIFSRLGKAISPDSAPMRTPEPEPVPAPAPAFRGPAPEAPAPEPEPVLDASGGIVAGGGSDYRATGFGGAPVLSAPVVAIPVPPPAAARFPAFPAVAAPATGVGSAAGRGGGAEPAVTADAVRRVGSAEQAPTSAATSVTGQMPRRGYTDYLRSPGLPQLAGAALPGVAGILLMTLGGGVIGYRQAEAGRMIRSSGAARYLP